jgi:hypothetical protein
MTDNGALSLGRNAAELAATSAELGNGRSAAATGQATPLPPARAALARAIETLDVACRRMEQAQHPVNRLDQIMAAATCREAADIRAEIARLRETHEAEVAGWVDSGAQGTRPTPSAELLAAERLLGEIAEKVRQAETEIPIAQEDYAAAAERTRNAMRERDHALWPAAAEVAEPVLGELEHAIGGVLDIEARLHNLISALREIGHRDPTNGNGALGAAERVEKAIVTAHRRPGAPIDAAIGHSFLDRLRIDPLAEL